MSDPDTSAEQRAALEALDAAITEVYRAYDGGMLPTEWVVLLAVHGQDTLSGYSDVDMILPDGGMPHHHLLGMLRQATIRAETRPDDPDM